MQEIKTKLARARGDSSTVQEIPAVSRRGSKGWLISWGCAKLNRVVSASVRERPLMHSITIDCPYGASHQVALLPRKLTAADSPELELEALSR